MARSRTEVTIETDTLVIIRRGADTVHAWCERCGAESVILHCAQPRLAGVTPGVIGRPSKGGAQSISIELPGGRPLICARSVGIFNHE